MKQNIKILFFLVSSVIYAGSVSPVLGLRFNNILSSNDLQDPTNSLGLKMEVGEGIYSGFDVSDGDFRIFVQRSNMIFGMGTDEKMNSEIRVTIIATGFETNESYIDMNDQSEDIFKITPLFFSAI